MSTGILYALCVVPFWWKITQTHDFDWQIIMIFTWSLQESRTKNRIQYKRHNIFCRGSFDCNHNNCPIHKSESHWCRHKMFWFFIVLNFQLGSMTVLMMIIISIAFVDVAHSMYQCTGVPLYHILFNWHMKFWNGFYPAYATRNCKSEQPIDRCWRAIKNI